MLGTCVAATNLSVEHFSLTIKFKETMEKVGKLISESDRNTTDGEFNTIFNQISNIRASVAEISKKRTDKLKP